MQNKQRKQYKKHVKTYDFKLKTESTLLQNLLLKLQFSENKKRIFTLYYHSDKTSTS